MLTTIVTELEGDFSFASRLNRIEMLFRLEALHDLTACTGTRRADGILARQASELQQEHSGMIGIPCHRTIERVLSLRAGTRGTQRRPIRGPVRIPPDKFGCGQGGTW